MSSRIYHRLQVFSFWFFTEWNNSSFTIYFHQTKIWSAAEIDIENTEHHLRIRTNTDWTRCSHIKHIHFNMEHMNYTSASQAMLAQHLESVLYILSLIWQEARLCMDSFNFNLKLANSTFKYLTDKSSNKPLISRNGQTSGKAYKVYSSKL